MIMWPCLMAKEWTIMHLVDSVDQGSLSHWSHLSICSILFFIRMQQMKNAALMQPIQQVSFDFISSDAAIW